jgi:hypothetical protein
MAAFGSGGSTGQYGAAPAVIRNMRDSGVWLT